MSHYARPSPHSHPARLCSACALSPRRKRIFIAGIAARRLQRKQESARMSRHARPSPHSHPARSSPRPHPARLCSACARSPAASTFSSQASQPAGFSASRNPRTCRATHVHRRIPTPRVSVAHAPEARAASTFLSQALQPAGSSASRNPRACRATHVHRRILTPRVSVGQMHPKSAPQAHFRHKHCSPQASAKAGIRAHVVPCVPIAAFSPRASQ